jgi:uncharacterized protein (DUF885 family)
MRACWLAVPFIAVGTLGAQATDSAKRPADVKLSALYTAEWEWRQREFLRNDTAGGPSRFAEIDPAAQQRRRAYWMRALAQLDSIPYTELSAEEQVNYQVFRTALRADAADIEFGLYETPFNSDTFFWTSFTPRTGFSNVSRYRNYIALLRDVPRYFGEQKTNMRAGLARGFTVPRTSVEGRDRTMEPYLKADSANPLFAPFLQMPASISASDKAAVRAEGLQVIREVIAPEYTKLHAFIRDEYMPRARTNIGASTTPNGDAYYKAMIEKFTTLDLTAKQIHDIGLAEVSRISEEMEAVKARAGFKGSMQEFMQFLRTDPQFYARTPRELLAYASYIVMKANGKMRETIGFLPRYRHGIIPVPPELAPIYTGGRGGLENCQFNTYNLPARPLYTIPPLALHECTPGHSFQAALAREGPQRPPFRRATSFSAYGEGWGLYTEWLGTIMGIYETPYEDFGRLTYEMWRACRLVIDTGIHQFGWTRDQARDYLRKHAALSDHEITTEVDRYIAWPGQALAYKLGELQIRRHRKEAEQALGTRFDQRTFHDEILALGSVPLPVLEERMKLFIARGGKSQPQS